MIPQNYAQKELQTHKKEKGSEQQLYISNVVIDEQVDDDKNYIGPSIEKVDQTHQSKILGSLAEDQRQKEQFHQSADFKQFGQLLVISQIRMDSTNDDPFLKHLFNVEKAIRKAIREILIKLGKIQSKSQFRDVQQSLLRVFFGDINIGFITSTGQIKSTAFIFMEKSIMDILNRQKLNLQFKKISLKITLTFFTLSNLHMILNTNTGMQMDVKQSFVRTNKFYNEFLILSQTNQDELKEGVSIFFVYRPIDDQIYAVKRVYHIVQYFFSQKSLLQTSQLTFFDIFSAGSIHEMNHDQRKIREAKILSKLTHPNILRLFDWWIEQANGIYYLYMQLEYCSFPGLKQQTTDLLTFSYFYLNPLPFVKKLEYIKHIVTQILDGLEYIHKRGIIHRDLKPENVFVTISITGEIQVMLADFDLGKDVRESKLSILTEERLPKAQLDSVQTQNTIKVGTTGYQTDNSNLYRNYDQSDEFFAIGVTLLHLCLTFPGEPKLRNNYARTCLKDELDDILPLLDGWAAKHVKNRNKDFSFTLFRPVLDLAKKLLNKTIQEHNQIRTFVSKL